MYRKHPGISIFVPTRAGCNRPTGAAPVHALATRIARHTRPARDQPAIQQERSIHSWGGHSDTRAGDSASSAAPLPGSWRSSIRPPMASIDTPRRIQVRPREKQPCRDQRLRWPRLGDVGCPGTEPSSQPSGSIQIILYFYYLLSKLIQHVRDDVHPHRMSLESGAVAGWTLHGFCLMRAPWCGETAGHHVTRGSPVMALDTAGDRHQVYKTGPT